MKTQKGCKEKKTSSKEPGKRTENMGDTVQETVVKGEKEPSSLRREDRLTRHGRPREKPGALKARGTRCVPQKVVVSRTEKKLSRRGEDALEPKPLVPYARSLFIERRPELELLPEGRRG